MENGKRDLSKERFWRRKLREWQCSGMKIRQFCAKHGLAEHNFYSWRKVLAERFEQTNTKPTFVPVHVQPEVAVQLNESTVSSKGSIEVILKSNYRLRVEPGFDSATLLHLLHLLEGVQQW